MHIRKGVALIAAAMLVGCNGGSNGNGGAGGGGTGANADSEGIYKGTLKNAGAGTTDVVDGVIDANGQAVFIDETNSAIYRFSAFFTGETNITGQFLGYAGPGQMFPNGLSTDGGSMAGTIVPGSSISGNYSIGGTFNDGAFSLNYEQSQSSIPASFSTVAGKWEYNLPSGSGTDTVTLTFDSTGNFTGTDTLGCTFSGGLVIPKPSTNVYEVHGTDVCSSNTLSFTGLATYAPPVGAEPATLNLEYDNGSNVAVFVVATEQS